MELQSGAVGYAERHTGSSHKCRCNVPGLVAYIARIELSCIGTFFFFFVNPTFAFSPYHQTLGADCGPGTRLGDDGRIAGDGAERGRVRSMQRASGTRV